jgi:hypothetical protein
MKKKNLLMLFVGAFIVMMAFSSFVSEAAAQSSDAKLQKLVNEIKLAFSEDDDFTLHSVKLVDNAVEVNLGSNEMPLEFLYEMLNATSQYVKKYPVKLTDTEAEFVKSFRSFGLKSIALKVTDGSYNRSVVFSPEELVAMERLNKSDDENAMLKVLSYIPFEKLVGIMDREIKKDEGDAAGFECSNGWFLITMLVPADEFAQVKVVYDEFPQMMEQEFKKNMSEGMDPEAMMLLELARNNGYKVGVKFHAHGYKPIIISLE